MSEDADEWIESLIADLKAFSVAPPELGKPARPAVPAIIANVITRHAEKVDPKLRREYFESAISRFDELDQKGDPYAETFQRAAAHLATLVERM